MRLVLNLVDRVVFKLKSSNDVHGFSLKDFGIFKKERKCESA